MRDKYFGNIRIFLSPCQVEESEGLMGRYPLTFVMAQKVINTSIDREFASQAMYRLHSCYSHVMEILKTNKALLLGYSKLTV
jgi:hypothetical protein